MKALRTLGLLACLFGSAIAIASAKDIHDIARASTVTIVGYNKSGDQEGGAGTIIEADPKGMVIVTAAHLMGLNQMDVKLFAGGDASPIGYLRVPGHDMVLLRTSVPFGIVHSAAIRTTPLVVGEPMYVIGNPNFQSFTVSTATDIAYTLPDALSGRDTVHCDTCTFGDSGGGLFDANGELVGVFTSTYKDPNNKNAPSVGVAEPLGPALDMLGQVLAAN